SRAAGQLAPRFANRAVLLDVVVLRRVVRGSLGGLVASQLPPRGLVALARLGLALAHAALQRSITLLVVAHRNLSWTRPSCPAPTARPSRERSRAISVGRPLHHRGATKVRLVDGAQA